MVNRMTQEERRLLIKYFIDREERSVWNGASVETIYRSMMENMVNPPVVSKQTVTRLLRDFTLVHYSGRAADSVAAVVNARDTARIEAELTEQGELSLPGVSDVDVKSARAAIQTIRGILDVVDKYLEAK